MHDPIFPTRSHEKIAADNRAELESWIGERAAELAAAGVPPAEARRRALEEFGDVEGASRYAQQQDVAADRRIRLSLWAQDFGSDLRIALRMLTRTPAVTAVVLLTFALGIGGATAVFSVVHAMLLRSLPYGDEASLVYLPALDDGVIRPGLGGGRHSARTVAALRERTTSFTGIAAIESGIDIISEGGDPEQVASGAFTANGFDVLQARPAFGRSFGVNEESGPASNVVVLLDGLWRRRFHADSGIIGRSIDLSGVRREVIGVMPPGFRLPTYERAEFLVPRDLSGLLANPANSQVRFLRIFGRVKPGVSLAAVQADVDRAMRSLQAELPGSYRGIDARAVPIRTAVAGDARPRLLVLMGAAAFVLLIACANVAGILLARAIARRHELSVRVALGAGRHRLTRQFLAEGAVLGVLGAGLGLMVAQLGIAALRRIAAAALPAGTVFALEPRVVWFAIGVALAAAFASALFPALGATREVGTVLRREEGRASHSRANRRMRLGLVAGQLAISVVLLVGAGLFLRTLHRLAALDLGYATGHALTFRPYFTRPKTNAEQDLFYASLYARLGALPGVESVGGGNVPTSGQGTVVGLTIEGRATESGRPPDVRYTPASDDYFATLGIPIIRGRAFNAEDRDGAPWVAVVSAGLASQLWPGGDALGARVKPGPNKEWATIVGIVGDVRLGGAGDVQPSVYTSQRQDHWPGGSGIIIRAAGDPAELMASIRETMKQVDPSSVITGLRTLEDFRQSTPAIADRTLQMRMISVFAVVALAVSAIGVYGVSTYAAEARRREFGIRLALGASQRGVLWLALREGANVGVVGALAGIPLALLLAHGMRDMLYSVTPFDPVTIGTVLAGLFLVVLAATFLPARRATLIDPARTMRTD